MHKSLKILGLAGAASALAMTPALASAQDEAMPGTTPPSMPDTGTTTTTTPPTAPSDTTTETLPEPTEGTDDSTMPPPASASKTLTVEEQQAAVATWPAETQTYYQSLTDERKEMFWALSDADKVRLSQLPEDQRELAWGQIESQIKSSQG